MANYIEQFTTGLDWARIFQRTSANPLDRTSMFSSYEDAVLYASGGNDSRGLSGTSYVGQIITVYENDKVDIYKINSDRTLSGIGGESLCFFCNLSNTEVSEKVEDDDAYIYIITEENSQSVFGISISELYNALLPKGEENESGETVISDWNLNKIPVILITSEGYLLNPTTYVFGDVIGIIYEPNSAMTEGYSRMWQVQISNESVYIINTPIPQTSYITFTIPSNYEFGTRLSITEDQINTACGLSFNQFNLWSRVKPVNILYNGHLLSVSEVVDNSIFMFNTTGYTFVLTLNNNKTIEIYSEFGTTVTSATIDGVSKSQSGGTLDLGYVNKQLVINSATSMTLSPNVYYRNTNVLLSTLTITLGNVSNSNIINEYFVEFTTSSSGTTISLPSSIKWANGEAPVFEASTTYQISIVNNLGVVTKFK